MGDPQLAGDEDRLGRIARYAFCVGMVSHLSGLFIYDKFPYLYFFSAVCLSVGYYVRIRMKGYQPLCSAAFYGMVVLLSMPVIGPIAGFQKIWAMPRSGDPIGREKKRLTTLMTLCLFIIFVVLIIFMIPSLAAGTWRVRMLFGTLIIAVIALSLAIFKAARTEKN